MTSPELKRQRRPYYGSCHCGFIRYIMYLTLPAEIPYEDNNSVQLIRKCNCTTCHKLAFFHIQPISAPHDFMLLSPLDPESELGDYLCADREMHWYFCRNCAVRCFAFEGSAVVKEVDLGALGLKDHRAGDEGVDETLSSLDVKGEELGKLTKAWVPKEDGWVDYETGLLRVNAMTLEPRQEGLDLREWKEKGWIQYVNWLDEKPGRLYDRPHEGGAY